MKVLKETLAMSCGGLPAPRGRLSSKRISSASRALSSVVTSDSGGRFDSSSRSRLRTSGMNSTTRVLVGSSRTLSAMPTCRKRGRPSPRTFTVSGSSVTKIGFSGTTTAGAAAASGAASRWLIR